MQAAKETSKKAISPEILAVYETNRQDIISRRRMRLTTLFSFNIVSLSLLAWALYNGKSEILFILPCLSFAAVLILCGDDIAIGRLSLSCARLIGPFFQNNDTNGPQRDTSESFQILTSNHFLWKIVSYLILLELAPLITLFCNSRHILYSGFPYLILWWLGAIIIVASSLALIITQIRRWNLYKLERQQWIDKNSDT